MHMNIYFFKSKDSKSQFQNGLNILFHITIKFILAMYYCYDCRDEKDICDTRVQ